eukprot:c18912_g1_i3.p1 GENE.c18912_g1_i3~~c18912_g1_i3.p1  ORF type:complete len:206 (+),score=57.51 c18912_g1_i3:450-1067(+)
MVQCTSCDDWLHGECAGLEGEEEFDMDGDADFLCNSCIATMPHGLKGREVLFKVKLGQFVASVRPDTSGDDATGTNYVLEEEVRIHATDPSRPVVNGVVTGGSHHTRLGSRNRRRDAETEATVQCVQFFAWAGILAVVVHNYVYLYDDTTHLLLTKVALSHSSTDPSATHQLYLRDELLIHVLNNAFSDTRACTVFSLSGVTSRN